MPVLWRYRAIYGDGPRAEELGRLFMRGQLYAPAARKFNDPFELKPVIDFAKTTVEQDVRYASDLCDRMGASSLQRAHMIARAKAGELFSNPESNQQLASQFLDELSKTPILCFFESELSSYMWAHYATSGSGIAIAFDFSTPLQNNAFPLQVIYSKQRPRVDFSAHWRDEDGYLEHVTRSCFLTKSDVWAQEREQRLVFHGREEGYVDIGSERILEVCLGPRITKENRELVLEARKDANLNFSVTQLQLSEQEYGFDKEVIQE
jgi:hypothetical protein